MATASEFATIIGDSPVSIGMAVYETNFSTADRISTHNALLFFSVKGLNSEVPVLVNNTTVGKLYPNPTQTHWSTQMVYMSGQSINNGSNELKLQDVGNDGIQMTQ